MSQMTVTKQEHPRILMTQKDTSNAVENNTAENNSLEFAFRSYKVRVGIFGSLTDVKLEKIMFGNFS